MDWIAQCAGGPGKAAGLTPATDLEADATTDPGIAVRRWGAERLLSQHADVDLSRLRASRSVVLRVEALTRTPDPDLSAAQLRTLLLDPAARVREIARFRAACHDVDLATVHRDALSGPGGKPRSELPLRRVAAAVEGLSLVGDHRDLPRLVTLLGDPRLWPRAAAASAVAARAGGEQALELLLPLLADLLPRVSDSRQSRAFESAS